MSSFKQFSFELEFLDIEIFYLLKLPRGENVSLAQAKAILEKKWSQTYAVEEPLHSMNYSHISYVHSLLVNVCILCEENIMILSKKYKNAKKFSYWLGLFAVDLYFIC